MASAPGHKFGQDLGNLLEYIVLERILKPRLEAFANSKNYYLDWQKQRPARTGKKVTWEDKYGNKHDLDFVIEVGGTETKRGTPVAFIEAAWRRYTKHSKNKAQEIQGAILPIIELHHLSAPFYGAVLAGEFTGNALTQLRNNKFAVLYIPYQSVVEAFRGIGFDIEFDEDTPDDVYADANRKLANLTDAQKEKLRLDLTNVSKDETDRFMTALKASLERLISAIWVIPLFGNKIAARSPADAINILKKIDMQNPSGNFSKVEIIVDYNNGDSIRAHFVDIAGAEGFLAKLVA
ncbi:hypothetical protein HBDW_41620 [Herbaspirillum sp. DW155]|uniref:hypothetical protein n=1 Tax=Herbaspirillum sp. DW155 TaxID=3095609 RepID=UPI0030903460|nr:hypothetical protein HBDW_41620 [Herbaspirillum sp. DW155]